MNTGQDLLMVMPRSPMRNSTGIVMAAERVAAAGEISELVDMETVFARLGGEAVHFYFNLNRPIWLVK